jgi:hypothetical protein
MAATFTPLGAHHGEQTLTLALHAKDNVIVVGRRCGRSRSLEDLTSIGSSKPLYRGYKARQKFRRPYSGLGLLSQEML